MKFNDDQVLFLWSVSKIENIFFHLPRDIVQLIVTFLAADYSFLIPEDLRKTSNRPEVTNTPMQIRASGSGWDGVFLWDKRVYSRSIGYYGASFKILNKGHSMAICVVEVDGSNVSKNCIELSSYRNCCWNSTPRHCMYLWGGSLVQDVGDKIFSGDRFGYDNGDIITVIINISEKKIMFYRQKPNVNSPEKTNEVSFFGSPYTYPQYAIGVNFCNNIDVVLEKTYCSLLSQTNFVDFLAL